MACFMELFSNRVLARQKTTLLYKGQLKADVLKDACKGTISFLTLQLLQALRIHGKSAGVNFLYVGLIPLKLMQWH